MTPEQIIRQLREHLLKRVIARNPLLHFRPPKSGFGKIDVCSLFPFSLFDNEEKNENFAENASDFFISLMTNRTTRIENEEFSAHLIKMQRNANKLKQVTGLGSVILGWPLVNIIRERNQKPLCAPLFFWKLTISKESRNDNHAIVSLENDDIKPEANFALKAWWNRYENSRTQSWDFDETEIDDFAVIKQKVAEVAKTLKCAFNDEGEDNNVVITRYVEKEENCFLSSATLGIANFKGQVMLAQLEQLAQKYKNGEAQKSLLSAFLLPQQADETHGPTQAPSEYDRYLAGESDPSQEKCVWQARKEEAKVLFLKGPPGTGKSETIVNLIADAIHRDKFVVVACHKQTAISVLEKRMREKRMGEKRMNDFVVMTTNPRKKGEQKRVIEKIIDTKAPDFSVNINKRNSDAKIIKEAEDKCTRYVEIISQNAAYSVKGHSHATIENVAGNQACGNFNALHPHHSAFIGEVRRVAQNFWHDQEKQKAQLNGIEKYAYSYQECDFSNNPWKESKNKVRTSRLQALWQDAIRHAQQAQTEKEHLPSRAISEFMTSTIAPTRFLLFGAGERHAAISNFIDLVEKTKEAFAMAGMPARPLWQKIYDGEVENIYREYLSQIGSIPTIFDLNEQWENNALIRIFHDKFGNDYIAAWHKILEAVFCEITLMEIDQESNDIFGGVFAPQVFEQNIDALKQAHERKKQQDVQYVLEKHNDCLTAIKDLGRKGLLRLRRQGGRPATTLRSLYHRGGGALKSVVPVLMTNPDSLCQLLPLEPGVIDLAIVDEASQMFTADALPVIFRAKQIIVSGDDMQMPPDDLFSLTEADDEDNDEEDDEDTSSESKQGQAPAEGRFELLEVIDNLLKGSPALCELEVHYRSRPAELIAFSNHAFYRGNLQTAADNGALPNFMQSPIQMIPVAGEFVDNKNENEINEIISLLKTIWRQESPPSVGVIVCNVKQAEHLNDRIYRECARNKDFMAKHEKALSQKTEDGEDVYFFVRSIEHVQGDERDVIIFATTYGERIRNYGLLTQGKGRQRLNVAITRAKLGMFVITSLNINNVSNAGERPDSAGEGNGSENWYLWQYLKYARAVSDKNTEEAVAVLRDVNANYDPYPTGHKPDSEFEIQVGDFLQSKGFHVDYQVGESGFRIDLGVKKNSGNRYLCGIECDGRTWHSGWRARQNDLSRQKILEGKGWKICRIWSDHWFGNKEKAQEELINDLEQLQKNATTAEN